MNQSSRIPFELSQKVEDILPKEEKDFYKTDNILFLNITNFVKRVRDLSNRGFKIQNSDIQDCVTSNTLLSPIIRKIEAYKDNNPHKFVKCTNFNLWSIFLHVCGFNLAIGFFYKIVCIIIGCLGIVLLDSITNELKDENTMNKNSIIIKICLFVLFFLARGLLTSQYEWGDAKWKVNARTTLQYLNFQKALKIQIIAENESNQQENKEEQETQPQEIPNVNNALTVDVDISLNLYWGLIEFFASLIQLGASIFMVYEKLGQFSSKGLIFLVAIFISSQFLSYLELVCETVKMKWIDKRVTLSKDVIEGIKSIKYLGWEYVFKNKIEGLRNKEFKYVCFIKVIQSIFTIYWNCVHYFLLYYTLNELMDKEKDLNNQNIFTLIALFGNMIQPMNLIPWSFDCANHFRVSFNRIQIFLNQKEINRSFKNTNSSVASNVALSIKNMKFRWPSLKQSLKNESSEKEKLNKGKYYQLQDLPNENRQADPFSLLISEVQIKKGELVVIIGKVGSGKTAFLNALLNELHATEESDTNLDSHLILNGATSYVSQNHWLQNKTVKENILFGEKYDIKWYQTVLKAVDLQEDLKTFSKGDNKIVGPGGGNLSGGQRQRVALARSIYSNREIYLLDDIFSSLDAQVADKIFKEGILQLLIQKMKKTVILITSHFGILRNLELIDQVILIESGQIIQSQSEIISFINTGLKKEQEEQIHTNPSICQQENKDKECEQSSYEIEDQTLQSSKNQLIEQNLKLSVEEQEDEELREVGEIKRETLKSYFQSMGSIAFITFLLSNFGMEVGQLIIDFWLRDYVLPSNSFFKQINNLFSSFSSTFLFLAGITASLTLLRGVCYCMWALFSGKRIFNKLNKSLIFSKMSFFDKNSIGRIMNRLSEDISVIDAELSWGLQVFLQNVAYSVGYPLGMILQFPFLLAIVLLAAVMMYFVSKLFRVSNRELQRLDSVNSGILLSFISEACSGIKLIRSFGKEKYMQKEYLLKLKDSVNSFLFTQSISVWMTIKLAFISSIIFFSLAFTFSIAIIFEFSIEYNSIAMALTYSLLLFERLSTIIEFFCKTEKNMISVERCRQYFDNEQENLSAIIHSQQNEEEENLSLKTDEDDQIAVEFNGVYLTYDDSIQTVRKDSEDVQFALQNVSFKIKKGEKVAFCGRTGSGKTSILNCLFGMYPQQLGTIKVHEKNISRYSLSQLRSQISIIPQFGFLYSESLQKNLDPACKLSHEVIENEVKKTNLRIRNHSLKKDQKEIAKIDLIQKQEVEGGKEEENFLDFQISDGGGNLSNGEKQIINFLRVILLDCKIVCLDEASSNMDPETDQKLHQQIFKFAEDKTLLVITHRLENIELFDKVIVLDQGKIVEQGHASVLGQIEGGYYNKLVKSQN